jgi:hypothetical protein
MIETIQPVSHQKGCCFGELLLLNLFAHKAKKKSCKRSRHGCDDWNTPFEYKKSAASATVVATASATTIAAMEQEQRD